MANTLKYLLTIVLGMMVSTACSGTKKTDVNGNVNNEEAIMDKNQKALVVFFSHAGDNYSVGNIEVGNTKIVADYISKLTYSKLLYD